MNSIIQPRYDIDSFTVQNEQIKPLKDFDAAFLPYPLLFDSSIQDVLVMNILDIINIQNRDSLYLKLGINIVY